MAKNLAGLIDRMQGQSILVIGDMVADIYLDGRISRISREAPVLVLEQAGEKIVAGGAANVVNNVATLGGKAFAVGIVGLDHSADGLRRILGSNGADTEGLLGDVSRPTISKTRIIAGGRATVSQQIVRIDHESKEPVSEKLEGDLLAYIEKILPKVRGIVMSDYGAGTITEKIKKRLIEYSRMQGIPGIVDSRYDIGRFKGVGYVKQNDAELAAAVERELTTEEDLREAGRELLSRLEADGVLVTRGERGMMLFERNGAIHDIPVSDKSEVYDVSGAGDTCVSTMILALAAGAAPAAAAELSNFASGIAVRKLGTATVSHGELRRVLL
ncbi:MAG: carbohydrate kinase [Selenomonadaceae bacterium]|nr:carbohydrate kinase [Selenomonadaceae bacterium]